ncbi:MAG: response regulator [Elusimicrobiota bacterium]
MPYKILIVDDNEIFLEEMSTALSTFDVETAPDGQRALDILRNPNNIDLVLLDQKLPGTKGTELIRKIRKKSRDIGIIILTAYGSKDVVLESLRAGADDFLDKGSEIETLKETVEKIVDKKRKKKSRPDSGDSGKIEEIKRFIDKNCYKKFGLEDAASAVNLTPKYASRIFKEKTGVSFTEYRLKVKLKEAEKLLKNTSLPISSIAYKIGYRNPESFMRKFKEQHGRTPTEYRN